MTFNPEEKPAMSYLDVQAHAGLSVHLGGLQATDELLELCEIESVRNLLYVGCGVGAGPVYIAKNHDCRIVGVDISEKMLAWSRERALEEEVGEKIQFQAADVLALPFDEGSFDAVIAESVLAFVADKMRAIRECIRVARPGGHVGLNESFLKRDAPPEIVELSRRQLGVEVPALHTWRTLWRSSGLRERVVRIHTSADNAQGQREWLGSHRSASAMGRLLALYLAEPAARQTIEDQFRYGRDLVEAMGYGLFTGRK